MVKTTKPTTAFIFPTHLISNSPQDQRSLVTPTGEKRKLASPFSTLVSPFGQFPVLCGDDVSLCSTRRRFGDSPRSIASVGCASLISTQSKAVTSNLSTLNETVKRSDDLHQYSLSRIDASNLCFYGLWKFLL